MAYGYVSVRAHDHQEYATGELVHASRGHVHLAHDVAERPEVHGHSDDQERYADQETLVRYGQVHDVHVGDRLHLGEPNHHVDDQRVAHQPDDAHDYVQDLGDEVQRRLVAGRVAAVLRRISVAARARPVVCARRRGPVVRGDHRRRFRGRPSGRHLDHARELHRRRPAGRVGCSAAAVGADYDDRCSTPVRPVYGRSWCDGRLVVAAVVVVVVGVVVTVVLLHIAGAVVVLLRK